MSVSIRLQIKTMYNDFSPKEQAIADYILENPSKVSHSPISNLASELGIADSTFSIYKNLVIMDLKILKWPC